MQEPDVWEKVDALLRKLWAILPEENGGGAGMTVKLEEPMPAFTVALDDPTGNSVGSMADRKWNMRTYKRQERWYYYNLGIVTDEVDEIITSWPWANQNVNRYRDQRKRNKRLMITEDDDSP
jgi:hypothetical protein